MLNFNHPFLVRLFTTYKDRDRVYLLLEPSLGGELFTVLRSETLFDDATAKFYAAHLVLAFEYMHDRNYIYRDLKPENLLLDARGYIKVTDFGFAKNIGSGRTWTLCGTPDYLAPEVVSGAGHGKGVDWWTLGIFIFEMLASYPPFYDDDPMKTYAKIMHGTIMFPSHFTKSAVSIIKRFLTHKDTKRLGVVKGEAKVIKKQAWFKEGSENEKEGFQWDKLLNYELTAKFIPEIKNDGDLSNFEQDEEDDDTHTSIVPYQDDGSGWDQKF
jgi:serine/threonine protein kinase